MFRGLLALIKLLPAIVRFTIRVVGKIIALIRKQRREKAKKALGDALDYAFISNDTSELERRLRDE